MVPPAGIEPRSLDSESDALPIRRRAPFLKYLKNNKLLTYINNKAIRIHPV